MSRDNITIASIYRLTGVNFWESAKIIDSQLDKKSNGTPKGITAIPFYFLISHSVELFLKSALLKRGHTEQEFKKYGYRHDLKKLLEALQKKDVSVTAETVVVINGLHDQHKKHGFRYDMLLGNKRVSWFPPDLIYKALNELLLLTRLSTWGK